MTVINGTRADQASPQRGGARARSMPPNLFGVPFGLCGLGEAWHAAGAVLGTPVVIADVLYILAASVWVVLVAAYAAKGPRAMLADLRDPVLSPFPSLAVITPMILGAALAPVAFSAGRVLVVVFLAATVGLGGWLAGQWTSGGLDADLLHPGYLLPAVAGGLVGGGAAAQVHLRVLAEGSFGIGIVCWLLVGALLLNRLCFGPALPSSLVPTLAIEFAPPAVAGVAYFAISGGGVSVVAAVLGGNAVLMAVMQLRFAPRYVRLRFSPGSWSFTFSYAAGATDALLWIAATRPAGGRVYAAVVLALITALITAIGARTAVAVIRGQLLAESQSPPAVR